MLIEDRIDALETTWINAVARLGDVSETTQSSNTITWYSVCKDILEVCSADGLHVKSALLVTGKLTLLARQLRDAGAGLGGIGSTSVVRLRSLVIGLFPETGVRLSLRGQELFARILPIREDERIFAERIIIGLSRLWDDVGVSEKASLDIRLAVEYLLRKRQIGLHCARVGQHDSDSPMWPYPSLEECDKGDIVWFLWGAWMCKYPWAEVLWQLFSFNYKRGSRTQRLGIMMGCIGVSCLPVSITNMNMNVNGPLWGDHEQTALAYIDDNAGLMWKEALESSGGTKKSSKNNTPQRTSCEEEYDKNIWNWVPRVTTEGEPKAKATATAKAKAKYTNKSPAMEDDEDEVSRWLEDT